MADTITSTKDPDVHIISAPYEKTSSYGKGQSKGPAAILESLNYQIEIYDKHADWETCKHVNIFQEKPLAIKNLKPEEMVKSVSKAAKQVLDNKKFFVLLGGEHSVTIGALDALSLKYKNNLTVLQIDAHCDLRDSDVDYNDKPSKFAHCCVMHRALDFGFKTVQVGIRTMYSKEKELIKKRELTVFQCPMKADAKEIVESIKTKDVYLTIDVDGIDPSHMPATGTPVQGGLEWYFVINLLKELFRQKNIVAADITEVAPRPGDKLTEYGAAQLLYTLIGLKFKK